MRENIKLNQNGLMDDNRVFYSFFVFCAAFIALFCYIGFYTWPGVDDWSFFKNYINHNIFEAVKNAYFYNSSGRIANHLFVGFLASFKFENVYGFYPALTIITYALAVYFCASTVSQKSSRKTKILFTLIITAVTLAALMSLNETLYWLSGMPYFWNTSLLLVELALGIKAIRGSKISFWLCILVLLTNGMMLEQPCIYQGVFAFLAAILFMLRGNKRSAKICWIFWFVSITAFLIMWFAPSTARRMAHFQTSTFHRIIYGFVIGFSFGTVWTVRFFLKPIIYIFLLFLPDIAKNFSPFDEKLAQKIKAWHICLTCAVIIIFMEALGGWTEGQELTARVGSLTIWSAGFTWFLMWAFLYRNEKIISRIENLKIYKYKWLLVLIYILCSINTANLVHDFKIAPEFRAQCEERAKIFSDAKARGETRATAPLIARPKLLGYGDVSYNPYSGWNTLYANYYGMEGLTAVPRSIYGDEKATQRWLSGEIEVLNFDQETDSAMLRTIGHMLDTKVPVSVDKQSDTTITKGRRDNKAAMSLYRKAALMGDNQSNRSLARLYFTDKENKNYFQGVYWLSRYILGLILPFAV